MLAIVLLVSTLSGCEETVQTPEGLDPNQEVRTTTARIRFPLETTVPDLDYMTGDEEGMTRALVNGATIRPALQQIVQDLFAGKMPLEDPYENKVISAENELRTIYQIEEQDLAEIKNSQVWADAKDALTHTMEARYTFSKTASGVTRKLESLQLVWRDASGKFPEKNFGIIRVGNLAGQSYAVNVQDQQVDLITYLEKGDPEMFVIELRPETNEPKGMRTLEQAYTETQNLEEGKF